MFLCAWVKVVVRKVPSAIVKALADTPLQSGVLIDYQSHVGKEKRKEPGLWLAPDDESVNPGWIPAKKEMLEPKPQQRYVYIKCIA